MQKSGYIIRNTPFVALPDYAQSVSLVSRKPSVDHRCSLIGALEHNEIEVISVYAALEDVDLTSTQQPQ